MNLTPAQRNQLRKRAAIEAAAASPAISMEGATTYELQLGQLAQDRLRLKNIQGTESKVELKKQLLPAYLPYVQGVLAAGNGAQDEVLTTMMTWHIDIADYTGAIEIAAYVLKHKLVMPDRFARTTGCFIAEEVATAALNANKLGHSFSLETLVSVEQLTATEDMPDQARAKLHLALGKQYAGLPVDDKPAETDFDNFYTAKQHLTRAIELHANCGGKKDLERVDRYLKKYAAQQNAS
ncbi:phage terminase small subunit [Pseudomonas marincola]|uniref:phage terminase small subunit n=1 Tax=Pseudomonas marincola TaxID=437900 RepID=UPI0008F17832|nr:phage terminase small subunit [Pseudomonas marincola]SFT48719.1 Phage small terminase subunit [Pseudomonas marincola]